LWRKLLTRCTTSRYVWGRHELALGQLKEVAFSSTDAACCVRRQHLGTRTLAATLRGGLSLFLGAFSIGSFVKAGSSHTYLAARIPCRFHKFLSLEIMTMSENFLFRSFVVSVLAALSVADNAHGATLHTVDIGPYCNTRLQSDAFLGSNEQLPDGPVVFDGTPFGQPAIPFSRPEVVNNAWQGRYQINGDPNGQRVLDIDVDVYGVVEVFTLLNTLCGETMPGHYATIEFYGEDGAFFEKDLDGDSDVRDYLNSTFAGNINGTSTVNVFSAGSGHGDEVRLDMQRIILPYSFSTQTLDRVRLVDNGRSAPDHAPQRLLFTGLTLAAVPEPSTIAMLCIGALGLLLQVRRRR